MFLLNTLDPSSVIVSLPSDVIAKYAEPEEDGGREWILSVDNLIRLGRVYEWLESDQIDFLLKCLSVESKSEITISNSTYVMKMRDAWLSTREAGMVEAGDFILLDTQPQNQHLHPLIWNNHWILLHFDKDKKTVTIFDSFYKNKEEELLTTEIEEIKSKVMPNFFMDQSKASEWNIRHYTLMPLQEDGVSCGLYVLNTAEQILKNGGLSDLHIADIFRPLTERYNWMRYAIENFGSEIGKELLTEAGPTGQALVKQLLDYNFLIKAAKKERERLKVTSKK